VIPTVDGDGLDDPGRMRRFNELIRRVVTQLQEKLAFASRNARRSLSCLEIGISGAVSVRLHGEIASAMLTQIHEWELRMT
jgi:hypothetical protein